MDVAPISPDTPGFERLLAESQADGYGMLMRFQEHWRAGTNLFQRTGECMLGLWQNNVLVGICGRNIDPYETDPRAGRVRHLYVARSARGRGAGRLLVTAIRADAAIYFDYLNTNAPETASAFYEHIGFERLSTPHATHRLMLKLA